MSRKYFHLILWIIERWSCGWRKMDSSQKFKQATIWNIQHSNIIMCSKCVYWSNRSYCIRLSHIYGCDDIATWLWHRLALLPHHFITLLNDIWNRKRIFSFSANKNDAHKLPLGLLSKMVFYIFWWPATTTPTPIIATTTKK